MKSLALFLPWPPSVNSYWRHTRTGRTFLSEEGKEFRRKCEEIMQERAPEWQRIDKPTPVMLYIAALPPDKRERDLDNLGKATCDALQHVGAYQSDVQIKSLMMFMGQPNKEDPGIWIRVEKL